MGGVHSEAMPWRLRCSREFFPFRTSGLDLEESLGDGEPAQLENAGEKGEWADMPFADVNRSKKAVWRLIAIYTLAIFNCLLMAMWYSDLTRVDKHYSGTLTFAGGATDCMRSRCFLDEFSLTHFGHGFVLLYSLVIVPLRCCSSQSSTGFDWLGLQAIVAVEVLWELLENSEVVIAAFRQSGPNDAEYYGDSLVNSMGDQLACWAGYFCMERIRMTFSARIAVASGIIYFFVSELVLYFWICDGFLILWLNLVFPGSITCTAQR